MRFSYNRAFRAPSMVQNFLSVAIVSDLLDLTAIGGPAAFPLVTPALGNPSLTEEQLDAFEIGYVATLGNTVFTASAYRNETQDSVDFFTAGTYSSTNPAAGLGRRRSSDVRPRRSPVRRQTPRATLVSQHR